MSSMCWNISDVMGHVTRRKSTSDDQGLGVFHAAAGPADRAALLNRSEPVVRRITKNRLSAIRDDLDGRLWPKGPF